MDVSLDGKVALVTGAGPNIGSGIALALARYGAKVACNDLDLETSKAAVRRIARNGGEGLALSGDVSVEADVLANIAAALDAWGRIDIVVNNAAWLGGLARPGAARGRRLKSVACGVRVARLRSARVSRAACDARVCGVTQTSRIAWRIRPAWSIWYPLGYQIFHIGHFLHDLLAPVAPWCTRAPRLTGARHSTRPGQFGAGHKTSSRIRAHDI